MAKRDYPTQRQPDIDSEEIGLQATTPAPESDPVAEIPAQTIPIVNLDEEIASEVAAKPTGARPKMSAFWFGEVLLLKFPDGTEYHVQQKGVHHISDPVLAENLKAYGEANSGAKVFVHSN